MSSTTTEKALAHGIADTPIGALRISASTTGLCAVRFLDQRGNSNLQQEASRDAVADDILTRAHLELKGYFAGDVNEFTVPLDLAGSPFQRRVWNLLRAIPYGDTISYRTLAERMGGSEAVRAVARANAQNPVAIIIPCHRVIGSDGSLTGYAGGLWRKEKLLEHEARVAGRPYQSRLLW